MFHDKSILREKLMWYKILDLFKEKQKPDDEKEKISDASGEDETEDPNVPPALKDTKSKKKEATVPGQFRTVSWDPYINFFLSLFFFLFSVGAGEKIVPNSILFCGISIFFAALCFLSLADDTDQFAFFALVANCLSM